MVTETNGVKMWTKRIALIAAVFALPAVIAAFWTTLGLPIPATAADLEKLDKNQATLAIEFYRDRENDLETRKREYRWRLMAVQKNAPSDVVQQHNLVKWIAELDTQIYAAHAKRVEFENRKLELEKSKE